MALSIAGAGPWRSAGVGTRESEVGIWDSGFGSRDSKFGIRDSGFGVNRLSQRYRDSFEKNESQISNPDSRFPIPVSGSFRAEREHRIDSRRAPRRDITRSQRDREQQERVLSRKVLVRKGVVDNGDAPPAQRVVCRELATLDHRDAHHPEVAVGHDAQLFIGRILGRAAARPSIRKDRLPPEPLNGSALIAATPRTWLVSPNRVNKIGEGSVALRERRIARRRSPFGARGS